MMEAYDDERLERLAAVFREDRERGSVQPLESRYGPGTFGDHEALHVANMVLGLIERELAGHPAILLQPEWYAHVRKAQDELFSLYQKIGAAQP